jgi:uncharacterized protein
VVVAFWKISNFNPFSFSPGGSKEVNLAMDLLYKDTNSKIGMGVFAARPFKKGELVLRPTGKIVAEQTIFSIQIDWDRHLDPNAPAKYLNHSCDPNLGVKTASDGLPDFYALRDIQVGEQILFDYAMTEFTHYSRTDLKQDFDLTCHCGSPICRGRLGYFSELSEAVKEKYNGYISDYLVRNKPVASVEMEACSCPLN